MQKNRIIHIVIIIIGIVFISIPVFHNNLWFDESYTVALSNHSFKEIWTIGGNDVHPILYYWILHIINVLFGSRIIIFRLFSVLCTIILGIIGYTHIRKDFGEKAGIIFSFLVFFLPVNLIYAGEIRMYSFSMLLVSLMSIYAYRIFNWGQMLNKKNRPQQKRTVPNKKEPSPMKNWILFSLFSLASAYTHYYGLMIAGIENLFLFVTYIVKSYKQKKIDYNLKVSIISAIIQVALYIPWLMALLKQMDHVSHGFWIEIEFPKTYIELFTFSFIGNLDIIYILIPIAITFTVLIWGYLIYIQIKNFKDRELNLPRIAILLWALIIFAAWVVSKIMGKTILFARYLLCVEGLLMFFMAITMAKKGNRIANIVICSITAILSIAAMGTLVQQNYGKLNSEFQSYLKENIKEDDIFVCCNDLEGFTISAMYPNNKLYFYDIDNWECRTSIQSLW